jgi:hypothetical protein
MVPHHAVSGKKRCTNRNAPANQLTVNHVNDEKTENAKDGHGRLFQLPLSEIIPSPLNDKVYKPVSPDDADIRILAESIAKIGLQEPLTITQDRVLISGHRRRVACQLAGLKEVPCRIEPIHSTDPKFPVLLREFNLQRIKSCDEVVREELLSVDPTEAHRLLTKHREERAKIDADIMQIDGAKRRKTITKAKRPLLEAIARILDEREAFLPLTDRQIHYALLNDPPLIHASKPGFRYCNDPTSYKALTELLTRARLIGVIPMGAIDDPTRPICVWGVHQHLGSFVRQEADRFLKGYYRDLQVSQPVHLEIIGEKNTITNIIRPVAMDCRIPYTLGRGYSSLPPRAKMASRFRASGRVRLVLLVVGDHDPEGVDIGHSFARSMRDDFKIQNVSPIRVALTQDQVHSMKLPPMMKAKKGSSRYKKFVERYGDDVYELEAVPPQTLQQMLRIQIDAVMDIASFNAELDREKEECIKLEAVRRALTKDIEQIVREA